MRRNEIYDIMEGLGYALHRSTGMHLIWQHPLASALVTTSKSASDHRAALNVRKLAERMIRKGRGKKVETSPCNSCN